MHYKSYSDLSHDIKGKLPLLKEEDFDLVVGIPRSGMIPAYMIAFNLNINCISVEAFLKNDMIKHGITRSPNKIINQAWEAKKILLVDDSIKSGNSLANVMERIPEKMRSRITTMAIYAGLSGSKKVDLFVEYLPWPRMFEWNILYHTALPYYCFGIDGILCEEVDKESEINDEVYRLNLLKAKPLVLPNTKINSIVTNRLEKYRTETESWLAKYNVKYDQLVMLNRNSPTQDPIENGIKHKAAYYKKSDTILFVEKDPYQAQKISKLTLKPVFCFTDNKMYMPQSLDLLKKDPLFIPKEIKRLFKLFLNIFKTRKKVKLATIESLQIGKESVVKSA